MAAHKFIATFDPQTGETPWVLAFTRSPDSEIPGFAVTVADETSGRVYGPYAQAGAVEQPGAFDGIDIANSSEVLPVLIKAGMTADTLRDYLQRYSEAVEGEGINWAERATLLLYAMLEHGRADVAITSELLTLDQHRLLLAAGYETDFAWGEHNARPRTEVIREIEGRIRLEARVEDGMDYVEASRLFQEEMGV